MLEFGNKFVPNYFFNPLDYFNYLLSELDTNLLDLNKNFFFLNNNNKVHNNIKNYYNDNNLNEIKVDNQHIMSMFFNLNKTKPNKVDNNNLYISKEINDIRSLIHSKLFDLYDNIEIKPNVSYKQLESLIKFKKEKSFKIINCDKNVGNAFISNDLY